MKRLATMKKRSTLKRSAQFTRASLRVNHLDVAFACLYFPDLLDVCARNLIYMSLSSSRHLEGVFLSDAGAVGVTFGKCLYFTATCSPPSLVHSVLQHTVAPTPGLLPVYTCLLWL